MERVKILNKLIELERTKNTLENLLNDVNNSYCEGVRLRATLDTKQFADTRKYSGGESFNVDQYHLIGFLSEEIKGIEEEINLYLIELQNETK